MKIYEEHYNGPCKTKFNWYINGDSKKLAQCDSTGSKKHRLFNNTNIPTLFPTLMYTQFKGTVA